MDRNSLYLWRKPFASVLLLGFMGLLFSAAGASVLSDDAKRDLDAKGSPILPAPVDSQIADALRRVSTAEIQHTIATLVTYRNRNTISSMNTDLPKGQGVSAAADWIESKFKRYSEECGGCEGSRRQR